MYISYWYPTIHPQSFFNGHAPNLNCVVIEDANQTHFIIKRNIEDANKELPVNIVLGLEKSNFNIDVNLITYGISFKLILSNHYSHGLCTYKIEYDFATLTYEVTNKIKKMLSTQIYHAAKGFFHNHIHHDKATDALVIAPIFDTLPSPQDALSEYGLLYHDKFHAYLDNLKMIFKLSIANDLIADANYTDAILFYNGIKKSFDQCLGELNYYFYLAEHINENNESPEYKIDAEIFTRKVRQQLDNIEHELNVIELLYEDATDSKNVKLAILGVVLGSLGLYAANQPELFIIFVLFVLVLYGI